VTGAAVTSKTDLREGTAPGSDAIPGSAAISTGTAAQQRILRGVVDLSDALRVQESPGTLFLVVRQQGVERGPPLAVKRFEDPQFPLSFEVGPSDTMLPNAPFEEPFSITARIDRDGDPMSQEEGELMTSTPINGVMLGENEIRVTLDARRGPSE
jgi:hypothetical protein